MHVVSSATTPLPPMPPAIPALPAAAATSAAVAAGAGDDDGTQVRVAARVRPLLPREKAANCCSCVTVQKATKQVVVGPRRAFAFDAVFDSDSTQPEVFDSCAAPLLEGCFKGYNATILAYGQTGSGKTHTMGTGQPGSLSGVRGPEGGITPKVIHHAFAHMERNSSEVEFKASCSYLEIYNEEIRDLLHPGAPKLPIQVRETADGVIQVAGLRAESCKSAREMLRCLADGSVQRTTGATLMNEQSSRSHSIFTIILEQRRLLGGAGAAAGEGGNDADQGSVVGAGTTEYGGSAPSRPALGAASATTYCTAKFHLVDLAGSERAKRTGAVGSRLRESAAINAGLLALGNVISALGDPAKRGCHVPYRDSRLTRILQDSLGGNSRTWMVACASCADGDFEETLNTLKYAHRARNIKNKPVVNHDPKVAQLAAMQDEIEALRGELRRVTEGGGVGLPPGAGGSGPGGDECAAAALGALAEKLEAAESQNHELTDKLIGAETDREALRRSLADLYSAACFHLPALAEAAVGNAANSPSSGAAAGDAPGVKATAVGIPPPRSSPGAIQQAASSRGSAAARHAVSALLDALRGARGALGDGITASPGAAGVAPRLPEPPKFGETWDWSAAVAACADHACFATEPPTGAAAAGASPAPKARAAAGLRRSSSSSAARRSAVDPAAGGTGRDSREAARPNSHSSPRSPDPAENSRLRSLSEARKDSTGLIRKYLDEIRRLEEELALHRRRTKQLQEELLEAREDLQMDEQIFEEKLGEMKALEERNRAMACELENRSVYNPPCRSGDPNASCRSMLDLEAPMAAGMGGPLASLAAARLEEADEVRTDEPSCLPSPLQLPSSTAASSHESAARAGPSETLNQQVDEAVKSELKDSRGVQQRLEQELQALVHSVALKEDSIGELVQSEREWSEAKAQYQHRMEQLQSDLEQMQGELVAVQDRLKECAHLKEQTRQMEEEKRVLERRIEEQKECMSKKQQEFRRLQAQRLQDGRRIRELEAEAGLLRNSQQDVEKRLQVERKRMTRLEELKSQQINDLQRRLAREGQKVKDMEAEKQRQRSATPFGRRAAGAVVSGRFQIVEGPGHVAVAEGGGGGSSSASSSARAQRLEQQMDDHIRRQEASQGLEEDLKKRDNLLRKRDMYLSHRSKIAAKDASELQEACERLQQLEQQLARLDRELGVSPSDSDSTQRLRIQQQALSVEQGELQQILQSKRQESRGILQEVDEKLEALQDELDFREAKIAKAKQLLRHGGGASAGGGGAAGAGSAGSTFASAVGAGASASAALAAAAAAGSTAGAAAASAGAPSLQAELASVPPEDAKELLLRCCEKIVRLRQREKALNKRHAAIEAQLEERGRQIAELQEVLRHKAKYTQESENKIRVLMQQLSLLKQTSLDAPAASASAVADGESRSADSAAELQQLRMDNQYFRATNRDLKRRLRELLEAQRSGGVVAASVASPEVTAGLSNAGSSNCSGLAIGGSTGGGGRAAFIALADDMSASSGHPRHGSKEASAAQQQPVEAFAAQVDRLEREKEALCEERERVMVHVQSLKQASERAAFAASGSQGALVAKLGASGGSGGNDVGAKRSAAGASVKVASE